jgi:hypothetical protein
MESCMLRRQRRLPSSARSLKPAPELLEHRSLLSAICLKLTSSGGTGKEFVWVEVPSTLISQSATAVDVTITRSLAAHRTVAPRVSLSLNLGVNALAPATVHHGKPVFSDEIAAVEGSVNFAPGETSQTVAVPIQPMGAMPESVPVQITAAPALHPHRDAGITLDLVSGQQAAPPEITGVHIFRDGSLGNGIAVTFSQPMDPANVEDIHNYAVKTVPRAQLDLVNLGTGNVLQSSPYYTPGSQTPVAIRAARYNPATRTVILIPTAPLTPARSFTVRSPVTLGSRRTGPRIARPLTDTYGNVVDPLSNPPGYFAITINHRYGYSAPVQPISDGT